MKIFLRFFSMGIVMTGCYLAFGHLDLGLAKEFPDIASGSELERHVKFLTEKGIIDGYPDGSFQPTKTINRAEALKIIFEMLDEKPSEVTDQKSHESTSFPDVKVDQWFAPYIISAKNAGIIRGYPDGTFRPNQEVNRAEFVKMAIGALPFSRHMDFDSEAAVKQFSDVEGGQWYIPFISAALKLKFLPESEVFKPNARMQRQEAAEVIYAISKYLEEYPQSMSKDSSIPHIPEEAFYKLDASTENRYTPEEFGPEKLLIQKDINKTDIRNSYAGYAIVINEIVDVENFERSPDRMTIIYDRGCVVDIERSENLGKKPQQIFEETFADQHYMNPPQQKKMKRLNDISTVEAYQMGALLGQERTEFTLIYTSSFSYLLNAFSAGAPEAECDLLSQTIASQFSILQP